MRNKDAIRIAIAESSIIIRSGLTAVLKRLPNLRVQPIELLSMEALRDCLRSQYPDVLIVNPSFGGYFDAGKFRDENAGKEIHLIALLTSFVDHSLLNRYDESLSVFDSVEEISTKIDALLHAGQEKEDDEENPDSLSQREKEIVVCVVKGMTNKEIAETLCLSIHTVITHRRNIVKKLQIHSVAGLTIYAIVNKLVSLNEVKDL